MANIGTLFSNTESASVDVSDFDEAVDDRVANLLVAGSGITLNYSGVGNSLTVAATGGTAFVTSVDNTNTVALNVTTNELTATIPTTATPTIAGLLVTSPSTAQALVLSPTGAVSVSESIGGAMLIENTSSTGSGLVIYSNQAAPAANAKLLSVFADNTGFAQTLAAFKTDGTSHGMTITHNGSLSSNTVNALSVSAPAEGYDATVCGVSGFNTSFGTLKVTHNKPTASDVNAAALSLSLLGTNTAAQGIFLDTSATYLATGKLLNLRVNSVDRYVLDGTGTHTMRTAAITDKLVADETHGQLVEWATTPYNDGAGARWNIQHGSSGSPVGVQQSTFKVSRYETITSTTSGAGATQHSAIQGINLAVGSKAMNVGVTGSAANNTAGVHVGATNNLDACGVVGQGKITGSGGGAAIGAFFEALDMSLLTSRGCHGIEVAARNLTTADGTIAGSGNGFANYAAIWAAPAGRAGAAGIVLENVVSLKWQVGIHFPNTNTGAASEASIRDSGTAATSLEIRGTHATAGISIAPGSGKFLVGVTTTGVATQALIANSVATDVALRVQGFASQSANIFEVTNSAGNPYFAITNLGQLSITNNDIVLSTGTGTKIGTGATQKLAFYGSTPIVKPTVSGARTGNPSAALINLLTTLATMGLIVNSTST